MDSLGKEILFIATPATMALAADPITSLIDTKFIGCICMYSIHRVIMVSLRISCLSPIELRQIHSTFHVSQLRKCLLDDSVVVPLEDIQVDDCLNYIERSVAIMDCVRCIFYTFLHTF